MAGRYDEFQQINTEILSISLDSVYSHKVWNETELTKMVWGGIPYPMLEDRNTSIGNLYQCYNAEEGRNYRSTVIIDPSGVVVSKHTMYPAVGRSVDEILRIVKAFQLNYRTQELTPANWQPGDKTLVKNPAEAGKVWQEWQVEVEV